MTPPTAAPLRATRAAVLTVVALLLATGAHVAGGGSMPALTVLAAVGLPIACGSVVLARRIRGPLALGATLAAAQLVLHEVFATASTSCHSAANAAHHGAHAVCETGTATGTATALTPAGSHAHGATLAMTALHALATLLTAALLTHGERVAQRLTTWVGARLAPRRPTPVPAVRAVALLVRTEARPVPQRVAAGPLSRRGPPPGRGFAFLAHPRPPVTA